MVFTLGDQWTSGIFLVASSCFGEGGQRSSSGILVGESGCF